MSKIKITRRAMLGSLASAGALATLNTSALVRNAEAAVEAEKPYGALKGRPDKVVRAVCSPNCTGTCAVNTYVKNDKIVRVEPGDLPDPAYKRLCAKGIA